MRVVRALALLHVAASLLAGVRCSAERAAPATSVVVVCDLNPLGKPAFPELEDYVCAAHPLCAPAGPLWDHLAS